MNYPELTNVSFIFLFPTFFAFYFLLRAPATFGLYRYPPAKESIVFGLTLAFSPVFVVEGYIKVYNLFE